MYKGTRSGYKENTEHLYKKKREERKNETQSIKIQQTLTLRNYTTT